MTLALIALCWAALAFLAYAIVHVGAQADEEAEIQDDVHLPTVARRPSEEIEYDFR